MNPFSESSPDERLGIYLNDHRALVVGELALADRARRACEGTRFAHHLTLHVSSTAVDLDDIDRMLDAIDRRVDRLKSTGARITERFGRLKLNGQMTGSSPLSSVVEVEGLIAASQARQTMWNVMSNHPLLRRVEPEIDAGERSAATVEQITTLREQLQIAAVEAFGRLEVSEVSG